MELKTGPPPKNQPRRRLVVAALQQRRHHIAALQPGEAGHDDELIHEIRVATKEFRAYLGLLREPAARRLRIREKARLQTAARSLAANRDPLVIRETLERLARRCDRITGRDSLHRLLLHLGEGPAQNASPNRIINAAGRELTTSAAAISTRFQGRLTDDALLDAFRREYRRTWRLTASARRKPEVNSWHEWRKRVKALHYQANCLAAIRPGKLKRLAREMWRLQSLLGKHHDLHLTRARVKRMRLDRINEPCRRRTIHLLNLEISRIERKAKRLTKAWLKQRPREFAEKLKPA